MGKTVKEYKAGDFIFGKVKGFPAWPARVQQIKGKKYLVYFYGTGEHAHLPPNMIFDYAENKEKFLKKKVKRRDFNEGVEQIEHDFVNNVPIGEVTGITARAPLNTSDSDKGTTASQESTTSEPEVNETKTEPNNISINDPDEPGELVIDEKKGGKKSQADAKQKEPLVAKVKPHGRPVKDAEPEIVEEIVSSRGRKIVPKRYVDEQTEKNATLPAPKKRRVPSLSTSLDKEKVVKVEKKPEESKVKIKKNLKELNNVVQTELAPVKQEYSNRNIVIAYLPTDKYVGIKMFQGRPSNIKTEAGALAWDKQTIANAVNLKHQLERGYITEESVITQLVTDLNLTEEEKATLDLARETAEKQLRVQFLKTEMKLIELESRIKSCLKLEQADTVECLKILDELIDLEVKPLMLIKHPTCVETIKLLRSYVGNTPSWELTESAAHEFAKQAHMIRTQAAYIYNDYKDLFVMPKGLPFWNFFSDRVRLFKKATTQLTADELFQMIHEPAELSQPTAFTMQELASDAKEMQKSRKKAAREEALLNRKKLGDSADVTGKPRKLKPTVEYISEEETSDLELRPQMTSDEYDEEPSDTKELLEISSTSLLGLEKGVSTEQDSGKQTQEEVKSPIKSPEKEGKKKVLKTRSQRSQQAKKNEPQASRSLKLLLK